MAISLWILVVLSLPGPLAMAGKPAATDAALVEKTEHGTINWAAGELKASGTCTPTDKGADGEVERSQVVMAAKVDASQRLLKLVHSLSIRSGQPVAEAVERDPLVRSELEGMVRETPIDQQEYLSDGTVRVTLKFKLRGAFSQLLLPAEIKQVQAVQAVNPQPPPKNHTHKAPSDAAVKPKPAHTGLVVDARGLKIRPALLPTVYDQNGKEVYGSAFVSREFAVQQGMCGYLIDLNAGLNDDRVRGNPLTVKGLRTQGANLSSIIISNADAAKLHSSSENLTFLKTCRVVIVVD